MSDALSEQRLRQRDYLLRIARAMNARLELPEVLSLVIRYAVEMTHGHAGVIALREGEEPLRVVASYHLEERFVAHLQPLLSQVPLTLPSAEGGAWEPLPMQQAAQQLAQRLPEQFHQLIALPLVNQESVQGVLLVFRSEGAALFTPLDSQALVSFIEQAAVAIQNAHLYERLARHARELQLLHDFAVHLAAAAGLGEALRVTAAHTARVGSFDWVAVLSGLTAEAAVQVAFHPAQALAAEEYADLIARSRALSLEGTTLYLPDPAAHPDAPRCLQKGEFQMALGLPLGSGDGVLGVLWVASTQPDPYSPEVVRLLSTLAHSLELTLGRFALIERLAARERQLSTVIEQNPAGILLLDAMGCVRLQNPPVQALTERTLTATSARLDEVLALEDELGQPCPIPLPTTSEPVTVQGTIRGGEGGARRFVQVSLTPLVGEAGQIEGHVVSLVDLTALKEAENAKRVFLAGLSHELKTPLSLIRGYAETLRVPQVHTDPTLYQEALDVILDETAHLTEMVNHMLLAARLQAGVLALEWDEVAPGPFVEKVVEVFRQTYPTHQWELAIPDGLPTLRADPLRLREVLHNLLSNAVKYSAADAPICVTVAPTGRGVTIRIRDEGIGIAPDAQARLFQRFFRASDRTEGTGLGLYLSKAIVEAHGGTIRVESAPNQGSTFLVELPRHPPAPHTMPQGHLL